MSARPTDLKTVAESNFEIQELTVLLVDEDDTKTGFCKVLTYDGVGHLLNHNFVNTERGVMSCLPGRPQRRAASGSCGRLKVWTT